MKLSPSQLSEVTGRITQAVFDANQKGTLFRLLHCMGMEDMLDEFQDYDETNPLGGIMVIGALAVSQDKLLGVAKDMGFEKNRFRFLDYDAAKHYDYRNLQYSRTVSLILVGPTPHKTQGTSDSRSLVAELESNPEMYPMTKRLTSSNGELKISKNNFRETLEEMIDTGAICPDVCTFSK